MLSPLFALALLTSDLPPLEVSPSPEPDVILSGVRLIVCDEGKGTGFVVGKDILATALHVAELTNCRDANSNEPLKTYYLDKDHDFALMSGVYPEILKMRISCEGYKDYKTYDAYGISGYNINYPVFRQYKLIATPYITGKSFIVNQLDGSKRSMPGLRQLKGYLVPGMSGGPITNRDTGRIVGMNNVGLNLFGFVTNTSFSYPLKDTILCNPNLRSSL